jgi:cobalt-zinc-cadmium efflux system protein
MHAHNDTARSRGSTAAASERRLALVLGLTTLYLLAEVAGALLTNSLALLADAAHMLIDVFGLGMALVAIHFAQRPATPAKTYGFYRAEVLAALVNSVVLLGIGGYILYEAWHRFQAPPAVHPLPMFAIAAGGLGVNLLGAWLLHAGAQASLNVRGAFLETLSDLLSSLGVVVAAAIIALTGWWPADPLISLLIALFIVPRAWHLLRSALDVLLEATPSHLSVERVAAAIQEVPGVTAVHDLHIWTITSGFLAMSAHIVAERRSSEVLHDVRALLRQRFGIEHTTLQVERPDHADDGACCTMDPRCYTLS